MQPRSSVGLLLQHGITALKQAGIEEAQTDATLLLGTCLSLSRTSLYLAAEQTVPLASAQEYLSYLERRKEHEPVAYIIGEREFWSMDFLVTPDVLIPRPETEFMLEMVFSRRSKKQTELRCLDLCSGSGVIAIVLALELAQDVCAIDISFEALTVTRENSKRHGVSDRIACIQADFLSSLSDRKPFSLIVSNPPYVKYSDIVSSLEPEVADHEPVIALDGGTTGLDCIRKINENLLDVLDFGGEFFMEIGDGQGEIVQSMFLGNGGDMDYEFVKVYTDYSGRDRVIHLRRNEQ